LSTRTTLSRSRDQHPKQKKGRNRLAVTGNFALPTLCQFNLSIASNRCISSDSSASGPPMSAYARRTARLSTSACTSLLKLAYGLHLAVNCTLLSGSFCFGSSTPKVSISSSLLLHSLPSCSPSPTLSSHHPSLAAVYSSSVSDFLCKDSFLPIHSFFSLLLV
jgi:hypothetical protein